MFTAEEVESLFQRLERAEARQARYAAMLLSVGLIPEPLDDARRTQYHRQKPSEWCRP